MKSVAALWEFVLTNPILHWLAITWALVVMFALLTGIGRRASA